MRSGNATKIFASPFFGHVSTFSRQSMKGGNQLVVVCASGGFLTTIGRCEAMSGRDSPFLYRPTSRTSTKSPMNISSGAATAPFNQRQVFYTVDCTQTQTVRCVTGV